MSPPPFKKDWVLTQDAFDILLDRLDRDPHRAGQRYEDIRRGLITFFECRGAFAPEDLADQTINRVARRLLEGKEIYTDNPAGYFHGVARNVLKELWQSPDAASTPLDSLPTSRLSDLTGGPNDAHEERQLEERRLDCLDRCLSGLDPKERELIRAYYQGETGLRIGNRKRLAAKLGIAAAALRIRALRIRKSSSSASRVA